MGVRLREAPRPDLRIADDSGAPGRGQLEELSPPTFDGQVRSGPSVSSVGTSSTIRARALPSGAVFCLEREAPAQAVAFRVVPESSC